MLPHFKVVYYVVKCPPASVTEAEILETIPYSKMCPDILTVLNEPRKTAFCTYIHTNKIGNW